MRLKPSQGKRQRAYLISTALVLNPRKLAAIDIAFLGARLIIAEYAIAVLVAPALGVLTLVRGGSYWQLALGLYLILLGINYVRCSCMQG